MTFKSRSALTMNWKATAASINPMMRVVSFMAMGFSQAVPVNWNGLLAWVIGLGVSLFFISEQLQVFGVKAHGPFAAWFGDADFGYFVGFLTAGLVYIVLNRRLARPSNAIVEA